MAVEFPCEECGEPVDEWDAVWQQVNMFSPTKKELQVPFHVTCEKWMYWRNKWRESNPFAYIEPFRGESVDEPQEEAPKKRTRGVQNVQGLESKRRSGKKFVETQRVEAPKSRQRRTRAEIEAGVPLYSAKKVATVRTRRTKEEIEAGVRPFKSNTFVPLRPDLAKKRGRKSAV